MPRIFEKYLRLILCLLSLAGMLLPVSARSLEEHSVLAALTLNIVRLTSWPEVDKDQMNDVINLCLVGDNSVRQSFLSIDQKNVGNKKLRLVNLSRLINLEQCQVLFVSELKQNLLLQVFIELKNKPILTIGDSHEFAELGGMVGLENVKGKINLLVNLAVVRQSGMTISARLLKLARITDDHASMDEQP
ncbi:MAG: YfiR family protein [Gammaproteobacteria bacterium]